MHRARAHQSVFHAIADPTRRALLDRLREGETGVQELARGFRISRPAVSKHLATLKRARLVTEHRQGRQRRYRLTPAALSEVVAWAEPYRRFWETSLNNLKHFLENE